MTGLQQGQGQTAKARADLEHGRTGWQLGQSNDALHGVGVDDEVLAALLGRTKIQVGSELANLPGPEELGHQVPNARCAFAQSKAPSDDSSLPRTWARVRTVYGIRYDALGLPRYGTGVR